MSRVAGGGGGGGGGGGDDSNYGIYWTPQPPPPFHLLEITIISAQDLQPMSRHMRTYASVWVHSVHKLRTQIHSHGCTDPTWNDKFVFRVDDYFLCSDTSAVTINIYARKRIGKDPVIGTVRVLLSAINPSSSTKFVALLVRRPKSLRPQGIINLGAELLDDAYIRSMPMDPAFLLEDILDSPNRSIKKNENHKENHHYESRLNRNCSVAVGRKVVEQEVEELESKLEKWRIDLLPVDPRHHKGTKKKTSCCYGSSVKD